MAGLKVGGKTYKSFAEYEASLKRPSQKKAQSPTPSTPLSSHQQRQIERMEEQESYARTRDKIATAPLATKPTTQQPKFQFTGAAKSVIDFLKPKTEEELIASGKMSAIPESKAPEEPRRAQDVQYQEQQEASARAKEEAARRQMIADEREEERTVWREDVEGKKTEADIAWERERATQNLELRGTAAGKKKLEQISREDTARRLEYGDDWKQQFFDPIAPVTPPKTPEGDLFELDVGQKIQEVPWEYPGANINYFTGSDAPEKLKQMILEAYAAGGHFIIPGNRGAGVPPKAWRIDSQQELFDAIEEIYLVRNIDPDQAKKNARQAMSRWSVAISQIENRLAGNPDINPNYDAGFDVGDADMAEGREEDLALMERDIISEGGDVPWWDDPEHEWFEEGVGDTADTADGAPGTPQGDPANLFEDMSEAEASLRARNMEILGTPRPLSERMASFQTPFKAAQMQQSDPSDPYSFNPFRTDARPDFNIDDYGIPESLPEAAIALSWVNAEKGKLAGVMQVYDALGQPVWVNTDLRTEKGGVMVGDAMYARATSQNIADLERVQSVQDAVDQIYASDLDFRFTQGEARLNEYLTQQELTIRNEHDTAMQTVRNTQEASMLGQQHDQKMKQLEQELTDAKEVIGLEQDFEQAKLETDYKFRGWIEENKLLQQQSIAELDAAMRKYDIDEASRQAQAQESLKLTELNLQKQQMQFDLFKALTSDPQMMFFMKQGGILSMFEDILGGSGNLNQITANYTNRISGHPIFKGIGEAPNIQEMAKMRPGEQQAALWGSRALTGQSMEEVAAGTLGGAPWKIGAQRPSRQIALT